MEIASAFPYYTVRVVGYGVCTYKNDIHKRINGSAYFRGTEAVVSTKNNRNDMKLLLQHELSHILGATHEPRTNIPMCTREKDCVFGTKADVWCEECQEAIRKYIATM